MLHASLLQQYSHGCPYSVNIHSVKRLYECLLRRRCKLDVVFTTSAVRNVAEAHIYPFNALRNKALQLSQTEVCMCSVVVGGGSGSSSSSRGEAWEQLEGPHTVLLVNGLKPSAHPHPSPSVLTFSYLIPSCPLIGLLHRLLDVPTVLPLDADLLPSRPLPTP